MDSSSSLSTTSVDATNITPLGSLGDMNNPLEAPISHHKIDQSTNIREQVVDSAVAFLMNPRIQSSPIDLKRAFLLQKKGLTHEELEIALERVRGMSVARAQSQSSNPPSSELSHRRHPPPLPPTLQSSSITFFPPRTIGFILITLFSIGSSLLYIFRRYFFKTLWPRISIWHRINTLKQQIESTQTIMKDQVKDCQDALGIIRTFLEAQVNDWHNHKQFHQSMLQDEYNKLSDLKKEIGSVRCLLPCMANFGKPIPMQLLSSYPSEDWSEIKQECTNLKKSIRALTQGTSISTIEQSNQDQTEEQLNQPLVTATGYQDDLSTANDNSFQQHQDSVNLPEWVKQAESIPSWQYTQITNGANGQDSSRSSTYKNTPEGDKISDDTEITREEDY